MDEFSPGQALRMREALRAFRPASVFYWTENGANRPFTAFPTPSAAATPSPPSLDQVLADATVLTCGQGITGNTQGAVDVLGGRSPEMVFRIDIAHAGVTSIVATTCSSVTNFDTVISVWDAATGVTVPPFATDDDSTCENNPSSLSRVSFDCYMISHAIVY